MSLNKFTNTSTGFDLDLDIGCDELKANNITTDNIDANTINGGPIGGGVTNPLTSDLKLGGFAIIEPLTAVSPALNIDQLDPAKKIELKVGGVAKVVVKSGEVEVKENLNMNNNEIKNVSVVDNLSGTIIVNSDSKLLLKSNSSSLDIDAGLIQFISSGLPQGEIDAVGGWTLRNTLNVSNNNIIGVNAINTQQTQTELIVKPTLGQLPITATNGVLLTENNLPGGEIFESNSTENKSYKDLNMNNNNLNNVNQVSSSGTLTLQGALGNRVDIGVAGGSRLEVEDTRVFISQFADLNIHGQVIWVKPNTMPNFFIGETTYIFVGSRNTANSYTLPDNVKIMGIGKNNSTINFNGGGTLFSSVDNNLAVADITLTSSNNSGKLFDLSNVAQDKTVYMKDLQIRNTKNGMTVDGYDLIDLNNCIFTYFETGSPSPVGVSLSNNSKVQVTSCEFLRWFQEGGTPATTAFTGNMLEFDTQVNAYNINGCLFHPQYDQNAIDLSAVVATLEGTITSNTFIDINLNTGGGFQVLNIPTAVAENAVIEANSIVPNFKSQATYVLSGVNTVATDLSVNNPNVINHNNLALPLVIQFATITLGGLITYTKKRSANFMIVATCNLELVAGTNNRVGLGLFVNGSEVPLAYSYVNLSASGSANQKSATLSFTGQANLNDTFQLSVYNATASNNVIVRDVNFAGIEI